MLTSFASEFAKWHLGGIVPGLLHFLKFLILQIAKPKSPA